VTNSYFVITRAGKRQGQLFLLRELHFQAGVLDANFLKNAVPESPISYPTPTALP
jgi:hypothetical protein